jgi:hypothetical protein
MRPGAQPRTPCGAPGRNQFRRSLLASHGGHLLAALDRLFKRLTGNERLL